MLKVERKKCKNCSHVIEDEYCPNCGQLYISKQTLHHAAHELLNVLDIRKGFLITTFRIFIQPRRLINEYLDGKTKPYLHAISYLLVSIGFFYLISELEIFGFEIVKVNQFNIYLAAIVPITFASLIVGVIPYMKMTSVEVLIVNFYFMSGIFIIFFLAEIADSLYWIYQAEYYWSVLSILLVPFTIYFFGSVFRLKIHKTLTNLAFIFICIFGYDQLENKIRRIETQFDEKNFKDLPLWVTRELREHQDIFIRFQQRIDIEENPLIVDLSGDNIREVAIIMEDSKQDSFIAIFHFKENIIHVLNVSDMRPDIRGKKLQSCTLLKEKKNLIQLKFKDQTIVKIKWNGYQYYSPTTSA